MGGSHSSFLPETYKKHEKYLFVTRDEMETLYKLFWAYSSAACVEEINKPVVGTPIKESCPNDKKIWKHEGNHLKLLRLEQFLYMPCMRSNPFAPRLFEVFKDRPLGMTWEAFLYLASSTHLRAPIEVKTFIAFQVFDFDRDKEVRLDDFTINLKVMTGIIDLWELAKKSQSKNPPIDPSVSSGWPETEFPLRATVYGSEEQGGLVKQCASRLASGGRKKSASRKSCLDTWMPHMLDTVGLICDRALVDVDTDGSGSVSRFEFERLLQRVPDFRLKFSLSFI